jgi:23S rRNA (guanine745-N1)-methyltransferase
VPKRALNKALNIYDILTCPVCGCRLEKQGGSLICTGERHGGISELLAPDTAKKKHHCFDVAGAGYVNLLPPGRERNSRSGDDRDMLRARSAFLEGGYYDPFAERTAALIKKYCSNGNAAEPDTLVVTDAGCGEGYHTCRTARLLADGGTHRVMCVGFDASKYGVAAASKRARRERLSELGADTYFIAGNIFALPLRDKSTDAMVSLFAPITEPEAYRTLSDNGILVVGGSGPRHLWELRELLYENPREADASFKLPSGFVVEDEQTLEYTARIKCTEDVKNLFTMTPFYYRTGEEAKKKLDSVHDMDVTVQVVFRVLKKNR